MFRKIQKTISNFFLAPKIIGFFNPAQGSMATPYCDSVYSQTNKIFDYFLAI